MPLEAIKTKKNRGKFICGGLYLWFFSIEIQFLWQKWKVHYWCFFIRGLSKRVYQIIIAFNSYNVLCFIWTPISCQNPLFIKTKVIRFKFFIYEIDYSFFSPTILTAKYTIRIWFYILISYISGNKKYVFLLDNLSIRCSSICKYLYMNINK